MASKAENPLANNAAAEAAPAQPEPAIVEEEPMQSSAAAGPPCAEDDPPAFSVRITASDHDIEAGSQLVHLSAVPPEAGPHVGTAFILVLDVSSSMQLAATAAGDDAVESMGFSRLDLVKHSVNTVIEALGPQDKLALVPFSTNARVALPATAMTLEGKRIARDCVAGLSPERSTNIWDGLRLGLEQAGDDACAGLHPVLLLLTDGLPNENPPRGVLPTLERRYARLTSPPALHTFGFGYDLDSQLLEAIALRGRGVTAYIPDASMVGTVFVNFLAASQCAAAQDLSLEVELPRASDGGPLPATVLGGLADSCERDGDRLTIHVGTAFYGQTRDHLLAIPADAAAALGPDARVRVTLRSHAGAVLGSGAGAVGPGAPPLEAAAAALDWEVARARVTRALGEALRLGRAGDLASAARVLRDVGATLAPVAGDNEGVAAILRDLQSDDEAEGQAGKAVARQDWWTRWGQHYLPSLARAHAMQQAINFKDPGPQRYSGAAFEAEKERVEDLFLDLPPPATPARPSPLGGGATRSRAAPAPAHSMRAFYNAEGGCIDGECTVALADGGRKRVAALRRGDRLRTADGGEARVRCVVETRPAGGVATLCAVGKLRITPWHPVRVAGEWAFPATLAAQEKRACASLYNLVLTSGHTVFAEGVEAACLGHGLRDNSVIEHAYFGTDAVIADLARCEGWNSGRVVLDPRDQTRDPHTGRVLSIAT